MSRRVPSVDVLYKDEPRRRQEECHIFDVGWVLRANAEQLLGPEAVALPVREAKAPSAFARGVTRGFLAPLPIEMAEPEEKPSLPGRVAELGGEVVGFALSPAVRILGSFNSPLTRRLDAMLAQQVGPQVVNQLGCLAALTTEDAGYGVIHCLVRNWDTFKILADKNPKTAADVLGMAAGLTEIQFLAFGAVFEGLIGLIRRGVLAKQTWDAINDTIRGWS